MTSLFTNKKRKSSLPTAFNEFVQQYPEYLTTSSLDKLRGTDYKRVDELGHVYLDFTGGNLYPKRLIEKHHEMLMSNVLGNPHSTNPTSQMSTKLVEDARKYVLDFFNASDDYYCIFTANASGGLKIVGECYDFGENGHFMLSFDNHNSVNGIREYAQHRGATYSYCPIFVDDLRMDDKLCFDQLGDFSEKKNKLFAFPAQSNVSGVKHPLDWIEAAQYKGWDVLLDAAAFVPTSKLDLSVYTPDFVTASFYKIFGYPTGLGCLLVRKDKFHMLKKPWFAGGTVTLASVVAKSHFLQNNHEKFENGTINYLDIPALKFGLELINEIGMDTINTRVMTLTGWLMDSLGKLIHQNGQKLVQIFGPQDTQNRGATLIMNFFDINGNSYPFTMIESSANEQNISIRSGCFCNPGIDEINTCQTPQHLSQFFMTRESGNYNEMIDYLGYMRGAVRISLGLVSNFKDVTTFIDFAKSFLDRPQNEN